MITKKGRKYFKLLSIVISFVMIVTAIPLVTVFADIDQVTDSIIPDTEAAGQITDDTVPEIGEELVLDPSLPQLADIEDGVYAIRNVGNSTSSYALFMDTQLAHWLPGYHMQQYKFTGTQTPCDTFETSALFKISKVGGYYVIRILRNSLLSFTIHQKSDGSYEFLTTEIPLNDADVPMENKFSIMETSLGSGQYIIQQYGTPRYVAANNTSASGAAGAPNSYLCGGTTMNGQSKWTFVKYTGAERSSVSLLGSGSLVAGEQTELYPVFYSTRPGYNQLSIEIQSPGAGYAAIDSSSPYGKIRITPYSDENMVVDIKVGNTSGSYTIDTQTWSAVLPVEEGIYFFKNVRDSNKYIQINNIDNMDEDTIIELHNFHGYYNQRWELIHVWNGYYKIISTYSMKALEAPTGPNNDIVWQKTYEGYDTQKWKFIEQSDGTYKISPKSNLNYFMAAGNISSSADQDLEIRTAQSDGGDRWYLRTPAYSYSAGGEFHNGEDVIDAYENWLQCGYISDYKINPALNDLNESNLNSEIVYFSAHGTQYSISFINGTKLTYNNHFIGSEKRIAINDYSLTDAKLYIYDACETASNKNGTGENLCTATIAAGADCVIGWTESIDSGDAIIWQGRFQNKLASGYSVIDAANYANTFCYSFNATIKSWRIYGNSNLTVNESSSSFVFDETLKLTNIAYSEHRNQAIATILRNTFDDFSDDAANIIITYTNYSNSDYVIDYYYLYNGFLTSSGYSIVVHNGIITQIRDNTSVPNRRSVYRLVSNVPIITQDIIDNAMCQARAELSAMDTDYSVLEQYGEGYYCIEKGIYYYRVMTIYETSDNTYGAFCTYYQM